VYISYWFTPLPFYVITPYFNQSHCVLRSFLINHFTQTLPSNSILIANQHTALSVTLPAPSSYLFFHHWDLSPFHFPTSLLNFHIYFLFARCLFSKLRKMLFLYVNQISVCLVSRLQYTKTHLHICRCIFTVISRSSK